jgi:hypothetical protein
MNFISTLGHFEGRRIGRAVRAIGGSLVTAGILWIAPAVFDAVKSSIPTALLAGSVPAAAAPTERWNQTLNYNVYWRTASAGVATIRFEGDAASNRLKISGDAHSSRFVSTLYRVEDQFESIVSLKDICSLKMTQETNEGRHHRETMVDFLSDQRLARLQERNKAVPSAPLRQAQTPIPACVHDLLSAAFYIQTQPLELGKTIQVPVFDRGKMYTVVVEIQQRETVKTDAGTFQAIRVEPKVFEGLFRRSGRMFVWYSDDAEHRLVQLKARISVGTITASLASPVKPPSASAPPPSSR